MITRSQKIRLGVFVAASILALLITIVIVVAPKFLEHRDTYFIGYRDISVTGLQVGGPVKYLGLTVGYISDIAIDSKDVRRVIVEVSLDEGTPIKTDTYADITALGITGLMLIELRGGSNDSPNLETGGYIVPGKSFTELLTGQAEVILDKLELALNNTIELTNANNRVKMIELIENSSKTMSELQNLLHKNNQTISNILTHMDTVTYELQGLTIATSQTMENIAALTRSDTLKMILHNLAALTSEMNTADFMNMSKDLSEALSHLNRMLRDVDSALLSNKSDIGESIRSLQESLESLNEFSRLIAEDPSLVLRGTKPENPPDDDLKE